MIPEVQNLLLRRPSLEGLINSYTIKIIIVIESYKIIVYYKKYNVGVLPIKPTLTTLQVALRAPSHFKSQHFLKDLRGKQINVQPNEWSC